MPHTNKNVAEWLGQYGLGQYARTFAENHIDYGTLGDLTDGDLKDLGLSLGHRKKLLKAIQTLAAPQQSSDASRAVSTQTAEALSLSENS